MRVEASKLNKTYGLIIEQFPSSQPEKEKKGKMDTATKMTTLTSCMVGH